MMRVTNQIAFYVHLAAMMVAGWPGMIYGTQQVAVVAIPWVAAICLASQAKRTRNVWHLPAAITMLAAVVLVRASDAYPVAVWWQLLVMLFFWLVAACQTGHQMEASNR